MYLTSITHRQQLFELVTRWLANCPNPKDGRFLTQVFIYENLITARAVREFLTGIKRAAHPEPLRLIRLRSKDDLRQAIVKSWKVPTPRAADLFSQYHQQPEEFYPGTPMDSLLSLRADGSVFGMVRFKRLRRIAEKCSRKIANKLAKAILDQERSIAESRAGEKDPSSFQNDCTRAQFESAFDRAERIISQKFREGALVFSPEDLRIDDGIGFKFVGTPEEIAGMEAAIQNFPAVVGLRRVEHLGEYRDVKLLVDLQLPRPDRLLKEEADRDWSRLADRGLTEDELEKDFPEYVLTGERTFCAEIILTTPADLVESEFGSAIHEARMIEQRHGLLYAGRMANNASYLISYMLALAVSPCIRIDNLPVKMWGRYVPDACFEATWRLFGIAVGRDEIDALVPLCGPSGSAW